MASVYGNGQHLSEVHGDDVPVVMKVCLALAATLPSLKLTVSRTVLVCLRTHLHRHISPHPSLNRLLPYPHLQLKATHLDDPYHYGIHGTSLGYLILRHHLPMPPHQLLLDTVYIF